MIERALELAMRKAEGAEVGLSRGRSAGARYEDDKLKGVDVAQTASLGIRVIVGGKVGSAHTTDLGDIEGVVARAAAVAEFGSEATFSFPGPAEAPEVETYDSEVERTSREELVETGAEMLALVKEYNGEIKVSSGASWHVGERRLINSSGLDLSKQGSSFDVSVGGVLIRGTDMLMAWHGRQWRRKEARAREAAERAIEKFRMAERTAQAASKTMPVILTPRGTYVLLVSLGMGVNGKNVQKGDSPLAGRMGESIASPSLTLVDDRTVPYAPASGSHDGEGVPGRRTEIISEGVLRSFLYDLETAGKAGTTSTGNGPGCYASNTLIVPGEAALGEMVRGTREGLLVESVMGLGQSNVMNGDFSVNVALGYKIENGEVVGRVKNVMLAGNVYEALKAVEGAGSEAEWSGATCAPAILVGALSVVARG